MEKLKRIILNNEDLLMEKILNYAKERNYVKYSSTLKEAWRLSISGLSEALIKVIEKNSTIPEMSPDDDFTKSEFAEFGIIEAEKHRSRGVSLGMFLGLMKYYQQSYIDLINESNFSIKEKEYFSQYIKRFFDHVELGFTIKWTRLSKTETINELQDTNRIMTNEKNKYLTIFESIYDPVILVDQNNNIENINSKAAEIFLNAYTPGIKYYSDVDMTKELDWLNEDLIKFIDLNKSEILKEKTIKTKTGEKTFLIKFKKMLDVSEKYKGTVIIFSDITERIKIENELKAQHKKLKSAQSQLIQSEKMAALGILAAGVAHEINNPTNYVYISSNTLEKDILKFRKELLDMVSDADDETIHYFENKFTSFRQSLKHSIDGSNRIKLIVNDLRLFSRLDEAEKKEIWLSEVLETTLRLVKTQYADKIRFVTHFNSRGKIECYPSQLNQVFLNIIINACQAVTQKQIELKNETIGLVEIDLSDNHHGVFITFTDDGCGMNEEEQSKIFEPFFTTKPIGEGTGLGMSISYSIIKKHNGNIKVTSKLGIGTAVTVFIPYIT